MNNHTCPGGAPFNNLMGLYLVETLSNGEWAEGRIETAARAMVTRAIAEKTSKISHISSPKSPKKVHIPCINYK